MRKCLIRARRWGEVVRTVAHRNTAQVSLGRFRWQEQARHKRNGIVQRMPHLVKLLPKATLARHPHHLQRQTQVKLLTSLPRHAKRTASHRPVGQHGVGVSKSALSQAMNLLALHHCFILGELAHPGLVRNRFSHLTQTWNKVLGCDARALCVGVW